MSFAGGHASLRDSEFLLGMGQHVMAWFAGPRLSGRPVWKRGVRTGTIGSSSPKRNFRPAEVDYLLGDATKATEILGWAPKTTFEALIH